MGRPILPPAASEGGATDLSVAADASTVTIASSTGDDAVLSAASSSIAGLLTAAKHDLIPTASTDANLSVVNVGTDTVDIASSTGTNATIPAATASTAGLLTTALFASIGGGGSDARLIPLSVSTQKSRLNADAPTIEADLSASFEPGTYFGVGALFKSADTLAPDIKFKLDNSSGTVSDGGHVQDLDSVQASYTTFGSNTTVPCATGTTGYIFVFAFKVTATATVGLFWSQNNLDAANSSYLDIGTSLLIVKGA